MTTKSKDILANLKAGRLRVSHNQAPSQSPALARKSKTAQILDNARAGKLTLTFASSADDSRQRPGKVDPASSLSLFRAFQKRRPELAAKFLRDNLRAAKFVVDTVKQNPKRQASFVVRPSEWQIDADLLESVFHNSSPDRESPSATPRELLSRLRAIQYGLSTASLFDKADAANVIRFAEITCGAILRQVSDLSAQRPAN